VNSYAKLAAGLAAVAIVAVAGYSLLPRGPGFGGPAASPSVEPTTAPTGAASVAPSAAARAVVDGPLTAGRYRLQPFADVPNLSFTADIPAGWHGSAPLALTGPLGPEGPRGIVIAFLRVDGLFSDPCHWDLDGSGSSDQPGDLAIGPSANLSGALDDNPSFESDGVVRSGFPKTDAGVAGEDVSGYEVTIRVPASVDIAACDKDRDGKGRYYVFAGPDAGLYAQGNGNIWDIHILTVKAVRLIIVLSYFDDTPASDLAAGKAIVGSFDFVP